MDTVSLEKLFQTNMSKFVKTFMSKSIVMNLPTTPILKAISKDAIISGIEIGEPSQIMDLASLINTRYVKSSSSYQYLKEEVFFLENIEEAIKGVDTSRALFSNFFLIDELKPRVSKAKLAFQR